MNMEIGESKGWCLTDIERMVCVKSLADAFSSIRFHLQKADLAGNAGKAEEELKAMEEIAQEIEQDAYAAASVMATTTTGSRPHEEGVQAYARKCSEMLLEVIDSPEILKQKINGGMCQTCNLGNVDTLDLSSGNKREFFTAETAKKALKPMMETKSVKKLVMSTKSFGVEAAEVARQALLDCRSSLEVLDASDVIAGRPEDEALESLRVLCKGISNTDIFDLDLSDNALGEKGVRACGEALQLPTLRFLALQNDGISPHAARALDELMGANASNLRGLRLYNNMSDDAGALSVANIISRAADLEEFRMASSRVKEGGCLALCKVLTDCKRLSYLDLSDNPFGDTAAASISNAIRDKKLRKFVLNDMCLGDDATSILFTALSNSLSSLEELELQGNELTRRSAELLSTTILSKTTILKKLNIADNEFSDKGAIRLSSALPSSLETLDLGTCEIGKEGAVMIAEKIKDFPKLNFVNLDCNFISEDGVSIIQGILGQRLGSLEENDPDGMDVDDEEEFDEDNSDGADVDEISNMMREQAI